MSLHRTKSWLAAWGVLLLMAVSAFGQGVPDSQLMNGQMLDPSPPNAFGSGVGPNQGYFGSLEALYWTISPPGATAIGSPGLTRLVYSAPDQPAVQSNSMDTGFLKADWTWGHRFELGDIVEHHGWILGTYSTRAQSQTPWEFGNVTMTIDDREFGPENRRHLDGYVGLLPFDDTTIWSLLPLPLQFDYLKVDHITQSWSVEWMYMYRTHPLGFRRNTLMELFMGVRYMEFQDRFNVYGRGARWKLNADDEPIAPQTILADSEWLTNSNNHIIGPQLGVRLSTRAGRWSLSTEGRFFAGFNFQSVRQSGYLGNHINEPYPIPLPDPNPPPENAFPFTPAIREPVTFKHVYNANEFSPGIEFRVEGKCHLTRGLAFKAGYTLAYLDGIARASNMVDYVWSETTVMGIRPDTNRQGVFMNGLTFGLEFNR